MSLDSILCVLGIHKDVGKGMSDSVPDFKRDVLNVYSHKVCGRCDRPYSGRYSVAYMIVLTAIEILTLRDINTDTLVGTYKLDDKTREYYINLEKLKLRYR